MRAALETQPPGRSALRTATHDVHRRLERRLHLAGAGLTRDHYVSTLRGLLVAYVALEDQIEPHAAGLSQLGLAWPDRRKAQRIRADLAALGVPVTVVPAPPLTAPAVRDVAAALGCMYVMEGATLGGVVISRNVRTRLQLGPADGASFFASYGDGVNERWHELCHALELGLTDDATCGRAVESAVATFMVIEACVSDGAA